MKKKLIIGLSIALFLVAFVVIIIISSPPKKTTNSNTTPKKSESTENHTHSWSEWITEKDPTCTSNGIKYRTCECGEIEDISFAALEHNFGDWVIEVNPKCNEEGIKAHVCVRCNLKETQKIDAMAGINVTSGIVFPFSHFETA